MHEQILTSAVDIYSYKLLMLHFHNFTLEKIPEIQGLITKQQYRTCDYSIGGIYMWIHYFGYEYAVDQDMLYMKARMNGEPVFLLPVGSLPLMQAIDQLRNYCANEKIPCRLVVVPEPAISYLGSAVVDTWNTPQWSDYLYDAKSMATYDGHALKNKRNRARKFETTYNYTYEAISDTNMPEVRQFLLNFIQENRHECDLYADYENQESSRVLDQYNYMPFDGILIRVDGVVRGFSIGERVNDTLFIHIEKSYREFDGINEALSRIYVRHMCEQSSEISYVNREEDMGEEGLRQSKKSYAPLAVLQKNTVNL